MIVIGVCGGVASGKSLVASEMEKLGALWIDADHIGHDVLRSEPAKRAIRERWGDSVFDSIGEVSRPSLASIVFSATPHGTTELRHLEQITHPAIGREIRRRIREAEQQHIPAVVLDAAVMFRAGWDTECDHIVFVDAPREVRVARARKRGWSDDQFARREAAQESTEWKRRRADASIDNSGDPEQTIQQVRRLWQTWVDRDPKDMSPDEHDAM